MTYLCSWTSPNVSKPALLGLADVAVGGRSAARPDGRGAFWRREALKWSIYSEADVTALLALAPGKHTVTVTYAGATSCMGDCESNYRRYEFHMRNVVVFYGDGADGPQPSTFHDEIAAAHAAVLTRRKDGE